jgi:chromate reductase
MTAPRILALNGSLRTGSINLKLLAVAAEEARKLGAEVDLVEREALLLPLYDGDVEAQGVPPAVAKLRERLARAQGVLVASPEYNASIPGALKNALDWLSRPPERLFQDKWAAMMGASPGVFGTTRMQPHLRQVLASMGMYVLPAQMHLPRMMEAFTPEGGLKEEARHKEVVALVTTLVSKLKG